MLPCHRWRIGCLLWGLRPHPICYPHPPTVNPFKSPSHSAPSLSTSSFQWIERYHKAESSLLGGEESGRPPEASLCTTVLLRLYRVIPARGGGEGWGNPWLQQQQQRSFKRTLFLVPRRRTRTRRQYEMNAWGGGLDFFWGGEGGDWRGDENFLARRNSTQKHGGRKTRQRESKKCRFIGPPISPRGGFTT